jgi:predicted RND superfamily exporter protein
MIGIFQLEVENSFIDYFKKSTEIYQGMKYYDQNFGGTTPLDIIIDFEKEEEEEYDPEFDDEDEDNDIYWYTEEKIDLISKIHEYIDKQLYTGKVLSFKSYFDVMTQINDGKELDDYELKIVIKKLSEDIKDIILRPYISVQDNQARLTVNIKDSEKGLKRNQFLKQIHNDLKRNFIRGKEQIHLTNLMVLYNNMLQSLYSSQIKSIGYTILALMIMFLFLFGSLKISLIAIIPNIISCFTILGFMGISGISLDMMTITIVAISMGMAVDNTIHYIHRFKHEFKKDSNYLNTMYRCHESIGKALYYNAITIIFGFSILSLSNFIPSITFGLLTSLAMLIALTASLTLLPILIRHFKPF